MEGVRKGNEIGFGARSGAEPADADVEVDEVVVLKELRFLLLRSRSEEP